ncbi:hypothetical protein OG21DRAFT_1514485 [Imleria badia]|nr:hypothetical protein OG21DRAFT_1514485 [Imleria badia]
MRKLGESSFKILSNAPTTEALFPNVRSLDCGYTRGRLLSHFPFPSLVFLNIHYQYLHGHRLRNAFELFPDSSPNIRIISLRVRSFDLAFSKVVSNRLCRWQNLQTVVFPEIFLDVDALVHLSCMPALTRLDFVLSATFPASDSHLFFPNLHHITLRSKSLEAVTRLLSRTRLPAITDFTAIIYDCPSREELSFFFIGVQSSITGNTIKVLELHQMSWPATNAVRSEGLLLCWEDLQPCMAFRNLLRISLDIEWKVGLMDNELLALALAWPHLEDLLINPFWGWNSPGGITPNGLLQLLEKCRSIHCITLAIDTRGYTELPPSGLLASLGLTSPRTISLDVLDSVIQAESVPAVAAFFGCTPCSTFSFTAWASRKLIKSPGWKVYKDHWNDVHRLANNAIQGS